MINSISISKTVMTAVRPSPNVLQTAAMFGLGVDAARQFTLIPPCEVPLPHLSGRRGIVFITGPSGSGKSTILKLIAGEMLKQRDERLMVHQFEDLPALDDVPLVDALHGEGMTLAAVMSALSVAGLGDAFVMLRRPSELSDGQRYRLRVAHVIGLTMNQREAEARPAVILADEFASTLDRITAKTVARHLRRWIDKPGPPISFIAATAHDDVLEALAPDVLVWKGLGDAIEVVRRQADSTERATPMPRPAVTTALMAR